MALGDGKKFGRDSRDLAGIRVPGDGPLPCSILLIGERPGKQEVQARPPKPFVGLAGQEMERYMAEGGLRREDVRITNLVKDYREGENPEEWEIARDEGELRDEIIECAPTIIGAMGRHTTRWFLGDVDMDTVHGIPHWWWDEHLGPVLVVPIYHPAAGFYNAENQPLILDDFRRLGDTVAGRLGPRDDPGFTAVYEPNWINPWHLPESYFKPKRIALDTEGWRKKPWGLSVSDRGGVGLVARAGDPMISALDLQISEALKHVPEFKVYLHNSLHDLWILEGLGVGIPEGSYVDTMVLAYLLCLEPQGLKPLAFRHAGMVMKSYDEVVKPYYDAVFEEYVLTASEIPDLPDWEEQYVIIEDGQPKIKKPWGIARHLRRILSDKQKAQDAGKEFDLAKRWSNIDDYKKLRIVDILGAPPEKSLEYVPDDEAIPYSACDAVATLRVGPILEAKIAEMGLEQVAQIDHSIIPMIDRMQRIGMKAVPEHFDQLAEKCTERMSELQGQIHSMCGALINPDSGDQVAALLFDQLKLDRAVDFKIKRTENDERYSTNDKILEALRFTHPVVGLVCDYRETSKIRSSFCWPISRYASRVPDRRIHPNLRITRVSSGRLACTEPNLLAIPVRSDLGKEVRAGFVAGEGHVLGDWDLDQVEMRYMADESQDPILLDAFRRGLDIHSKTASLVFGKPYDEVVGDKKLRAILRDPAKRVGFGVITGITGVGLVAQMRLANATKDGIPIADGGTPWSEDDCDKLIEEYFRIHTGVRDYFDRCRAEARRFGYVRDRWGRIRYLPAAHSTIKWLREEALRQSHSHKIQAGAQGIMKQGMAQVWEMIKEWWRQGHWIEPLLQVHDELLLEVEDDPEFKAEVDQIVPVCLSQTVQLSVPLGAKGGFAYNWGELK